MPLRWAAPTLVAAVLAGVYVVVAPTSVDLAAHLFRAQMFRQQGFAIYNTYWYAGNAVLSYSVLFPAVSALLGPQLAAALATTGTATVFTPLARRHFGDRAWLGAVLFGAATAADLYSGRLAFAFGALPAIAAIAALDDDRPALASALGLVAALCSPVAALFAALIAAGHALGGALIARRDLRLVGLVSDRPGAARPSRSPGLAAVPAIRAQAGPMIHAALPGVSVIVASLAPVLVLSWMFPQGGSEPFAVSTMLPPVVVSAAAVALLPRQLVRLRAGVAVYAVATLALFAIPSPVGSNIERLWTFAALPLAVIVWRGVRPRILALLLLPLLYIAWSPAVRDTIAGVRDHTASTAYYAPLLRFLERQAAGTAPFRTEIPFTQFHWESYEIATRFSLARGWERQLDIGDNHIFYGGRLTAGSYERWLHDNAVRFVAVSDAPPDYSAIAETKLVDSGLPYLRPVFRSRHWRVYEVSGATGIVQRPAVLERLTPDTLTLRAPRPGTYTVRLRFTSYFKLVRGAGCVAPAGRWTKVTVRRAGEAELATSFSLGRIGATSPRCS